MRAAMKPGIDTAPRIIHMRWVVLAAALFGIIAALNQCGRVDIAWKEEVVLDSGEVIIVRRTAKGEPLGELGGTGGWNATAMTLEISAPKADTNPPIWSEPWVPILFDRDEATGEWFVVATFYTCEGWYALERPKLPYVQFKTRQGRWEQVPLDPKLFGRQANLLVGPRSGGESTLVPLSEQRDRNERASAKYKNVLASWKTTC